MASVLDHEKPLHPVFANLVRSHLATGKEVLAQDLPVLLERASTAERLALAKAISRAFSAIDRELDYAMVSLDDSINEATSLNKQLKARAESLEVALEEKARALVELGKVKGQLVTQEKLASIGTLAAGIAHEINTPTQFVSDNLSFLKDAFDSILKVVASIDSANNLDPAAALANIQTTCKECDLDFFKEEIPGAIRQSTEGMERVAHIVRSMKEFSHPGKGSKQAIDINRNILSTLTVCRNEWKYVAELETDLATDLPLVPCAPSEINQVILNLVVNAVHAIQDTGKGAQALGTIKVSSQLDGAGVRIDIIDSGCGIPDAIRDSVFNPFFTTKEVGRGTGQGLALAHAVVVEKHQGHLTFDSIQGKGTTFHLWLPLAGSLT